VVERGEMGSFACSCRPLGAVTNQVEGCEKERYVSFKEIFVAVGSRQSQCLRAASQHRSEIVEDAMCPWLGSARASRSVRSTPTYLAPASQLCRETSREDEASRIREAREPVDTPRSDSWRPVAGAGLETRRESAVPIDEASEQSKCDPAHGER